MEAICDKGIYVATIMKSRYHGTFNVSGEVVNLYCHARSAPNAKLLLLRQLCQKYKRKIFLTDVDARIKRVDA